MHLSITYITPAAGCHSGSVLLKDEVKKVDILGFFNILEVDILEVDILEVDILEVDILEVDI
jgi:hypothetical protein